MAATRTPDFRRDDAPPREPGEKAADKANRATSDLEEAIMQTVDPDSWQPAKGYAPGSITYVSETGSLVIRQSWSAHRKIVRLLLDLREAKAAGERERTK